MFTYKRVGGLHFVRIMRLGFSFYIASKAKPKTLVVDGLSKRPYNTYKTTRSRQ